MLEHEQQAERWVTRKEATAILSRNAGRPIDYTYIGLLAKLGKVAVKALDGRTNLYRLSDVENYVVKRNDEPRKVLANTH